MLPMIAAANLWLFFYTPGIGLFDRIIGVFGFAAMSGAAGGGGAPMSTP